MKDYLFESPLIEGVIEKRKSQFTMQVTVDGESLSCHCPTTGRIGDLDIAGRPCLLSKSKDEKRKTPYTVEAVSLNRPEDEEKSWIGINQNAANRYVEHYLRNGGFQGMIGLETHVEREKFLGHSKLDFLVGTTFIEVKSPLQQLQLPIPAYVKRKKYQPFGATDRFVRHITELAEHLSEGQRAILLTNFIYDNPGFKVIKPSVHADEVRAAVARAQTLGVEFWQSNFRITPEGVYLEKYMRIEV